MMIELKPVTADNLTECFNINSGIGVEYLAPVSRQIAMSYVYPSKIPLAVYNDENLIGFASYERDTEPRTAYDILVLVIDEKYQGKGYGTETLKALVEHLFGFGDCEVVTLNYNKGNERAGHIYKKVGFKETGGINPMNNEVVMELTRRGFNGKKADIQKQG